MDCHTPYPLLFLSDTYPTEMYFCMLRAFYRYVNDGYILIVVLCTSLISPSPCTTKDVVLVNFPYPCTATALHGGLLWAGFVSSRAHDLGHTIRVLYATDIAISDVSLNPVAVLASTLIQSSWRT